MTPLEAKVSVIDPISPAIERVKTILFRPFDLGKWFVIGFCAWLAYLGKGGGVGGGGGPNFQHNGEARQAIEQARHFIIENLFWIVPVAIFVVALIIVLWLVIAWLSSRGRFMFLHCVALNKAEVTIPWTKFRQHGNSLFGFKVVLGLIGFGVVALPSVVAIGLIVLMLYRGGPHIIPIIGIVMVFLIIFALSLVFFLIQKFTTDFVVPIMFLRTSKCVAAWREFLTILSANKGRFALYILFQIVIGLCTSTIVFAAMCLTCCCLACILAIPYIGTVVLLPLLVFGRAYSLYYLRQFGPQFDVFQPVAEVA
jgi:hypothetical protein